MDSIAARVLPGEFAGTSALVVGGSRGLGELVGKILAVGGAEVTLTYSVGEGDSRRVEAEITAYGGNCNVMHYDVRKNAEIQVSQLYTTPNQLYYLATPVIFRRKNSIFDHDLFDEFTEYYVTGFYDLCIALQQKTGREISIFYPSSVFVDHRPVNMTEYAMAKAAGEVLCADMRSCKNPGRILVRRLPRLPTDQTASLVGVETANPLDVMLPIVREVHSNRRANA
jgi:NAD(P)-dependent dehydrogenase (short-subunit alcohol dehydrogenase family)